MINISRCKQLTRITLSIIKQILCHKMINGVKNEDNFKMIISFIKGGKIVKKACAILEK